MTVLVDTSIWSLALRRKPNDLSSHELSLVQGLDRTIRSGEVRIIGAVRQEVLAGIRDDARFERIRSELRDFPDVAMKTDDYEEAARMNNMCRQRGVAGTSIDLLLCAVASRNQWSIFTTDRDFERYHRILGVKLFTV